MLTASRLPFCGRRDYMSNELFTCLTPITVVGSPARWTGQPEFWYTIRVAASEARSS